jgi:hypothetical protein
VLAASHDFPPVAPDPAEGDGDHRAVFIFRELPGYGRPVGPVNGDALVLDEVGHLGVDGGPVDEELPMHRRAGAQGSCRARQPEGGDRLPSANAEKTSDAGRRISCSTVAECSSCHHSSSEPPKSSTPG